MKAQTCRKHGAGLLLFRGQAFGTLILAVTLLASGLWSRKAVAQQPQPMQLRLLGSDYSFWRSITHDGQGEADPNPRVFVFNPPMGFPTNYGDATPPDHESWGGQPFGQGSDYPNDPLALCNWPTMTNGFFTGAVCGQSSDTNDTIFIYNEAIFDYDLWAMPPGSSPDDAVQVAIDYWATNGADPSAHFSTADVPVTFKVKGGYFDGVPATLPAAVGYAVTLVPFGDAHNQEVSGDFILAVDWGNDLLTNREFMILHLHILTYADGGNLCLSLPSYCMQFLGTPDALSFQNHVVSSLIAQLGSGDAYLQGAAPEQIFFYDFSMDHTVWPFKTIGSINSMFNPFPAVDFSFINQYDSGTEFGLPTASDDPRPGGNACGPMSLMMAMNVANADTFISSDVYNNTMLNPPANGINNSFYWPRAQAWLRGSASFNHTNFPSPRSASLPVDFLEQTGAGIPGAWSKIDALLANEQPVVLRTDLGTGNTPGGGHVILLLGKGSSDRIADLYGTSGDYYIVADPAGHYAADTRIGHHYLTVGGLKDEMEGINYGGWFAMYPAELIRERITLEGVPTVRALTIGAPFSAALQLQAQSPVAIMVTDPAGKQTGVQPDGTVVDGIPQSAYESPVGDGEDGTEVDPTGPKTVRIDSPMAGTYTIDITGTNAGSYALVAMQGGSDGGNLGSNGFTGTISPGQKMTYQFTAIPSGPPPLLSTLQGRSLGLFWTTNYVGYTLQANGDLADPNGWSTVGGVTVNGAFNVLTNPSPTGTRFYRLKSP